MKKFLIGLLTIILTFALITLGITINLKNTIVDTLSNTVKEEVTTSLVDSISKETGTNDKKLKNDITEFINNNPEIEQITTTVIDKTIDVLAGETKSIKIDIADEVATILDESEKILAKYDVTLTKEDRNEIIRIAESGELNDILNEALAEIDSESSNEFTLIADIYKFINNDLKLILIGIISISIILIALLKKSIYSWMPYVGTALTLTGIILGFLCPFLINLLNDAIKEEDITISASPIQTFGIICLVVGIIMIILNKVITYIQKNKSTKKEPEEVNDNTSNEETKDNTEIKENDSESPKKS